MPKAWYLFMGSDPLSAENYYHIPKHDCLCGNTICCIYVNDDGPKLTHPLSLNLQKYIKDAMATGQLQPAKPSHAKKYVYLRDTL